MIPESKWKWFGVAGHFICGQWCRFHLCTQIGEYLISTVGEYVHPRHSGGNEGTENEWLNKNWPGEDVGCDRKYETMVFKTDKICNKPDCNCGQPTIVPTELDFEGYNIRGQAAEGHLKMCRKWAKK